MLSRSKDLRRAADRGQLDLVRKRVDEGLDVSAPDSRGRKPLYLAAFQGHVAVVRLLLDRGADATDAHEKVDIENETEQDRQQRMINLHHDEDFQDNPALNGMSALCIAAQEGHVEVVRSLAERGANMEVSDRTERIPLYLAVEREHAEIVRLLADRGVDTNVVYRNSFTLLLVACQEGHLEVVKLLVERGANIHHTVKIGYTALSLAARCGYPQIVRFLARGEQTLTLSTATGRRLFSKQRPGGILRRQYCWSN